MTPTLKKSGISKSTAVQANRDALPRTGTFRFLQQNKVVVNESPRRESSGEVKGSPDVLALLALMTLLAGCTQTVQSCMFCGHVLMCLILVHADNSRFPKCPSQTAAADSLHAANPTKSTRSQA
jgi:hypothetical protein